MTTFPPQSFVTSGETDRVMDSIYWRTRRHAVLGPVFSAHVGESDAAWAAHGEKIGRFWKNAILREGEYDGRSMAVHRAAGNVMPEHLPLWLALFDDTVTAVLSAEKAAALSALAHRIGASFRMGVDEARRSEAAVPRLG